MYLKMEKAKLGLVIEKIIEKVEENIPEYMKDPADRSISEGNVAICIIDKQGRIFGKLFGTDKNKSRGFYNVAWKKASQVWITGYDTGKFEELVYSKKISCEQFGLSKPDLIGWEGGQLVKINNDVDLAVGFSGFRGHHDLEIVKKAVDEVLKSEN
jgi:uncharacterized protein GlcG (DUF336 family)